MSNRKYSDVDDEQLIVRIHDGGEDLVCAGVTSILAGGFNNLENPESFELKLEEGYACAKALKEVSSHDEIVLETIVTSLKTMEESWPQFINIKNF